MVTMMKILTSTKPSAEKTHQMPVTDVTANQQIRANLNDSSASTAIVVGDSFAGAPIVEHYNNYTSAGQHSAAVHNLSETQNTSPNTWEGMKTLLPWWFVQMLRKSNPNSDWIKQMLEEAGLENLETEAVTASEELLEDIENSGGTSQQSFDQQ